MIDLLLIILSTSSFVLPTPFAELVFKDDNIVGDLNAYGQETPFLTAASMPEDPLIYPNTDQIRNLPGHFRSRIKFPKYSEYSSGLQWLFGEFLNSSHYHRDLRHVEPTGIHVEDQEYGFKAMIVSEQSWNSLFASLTATQIRIAERELEEQREKERQEAESRLTTKKPVHRSRTRPRRSLSRKRTDRRNAELYAQIPPLNKVEYPVAEIIQELQRCKDEDVDETKATNFKVLESKAGIYTGFAIYRVNCVPIAELDKTFVAIGLLRVIYETIGEDKSDQQNDLREAKIFAYADALLRDHVYENYYLPYLYNLEEESYPKIKSFTKPPFSSPRNTNTPRRLPPPERQPTTITTSTTFTTTITTPPSSGENEYGDEENEYEEKKGDESSESAYSGITGTTEEDEAWPDDAIDTNRAPKRATVKTKRKRNGSGNIVINIDKRNRRTANGDVNNRNAGNRRNHRNGNNNGAYSRRHGKRSHDLSGSSNGRQSTQPAESIDDFMDRADATFRSVDEQRTLGNCQLEPHDVVIVMDESGSIGSSDFELAKIFVANVTQMLRIGTGDYNSRVGLVTFSSSARVIFKLSTHMSNNDVFNAVTAVSYTSGGTDIASGMDAAIDQVFAHADDDRHWIPNLMIVMTDGQDSSDVAGAHARAAQKKINTTAIGIGSGVNVAQLSKVTGDAKQVFSVSDFASLLDKEFIKKLCTQLGNGMQDFRWIVPDQVELVKEIPQPVEMESVEMTD